MQAPPHEHEFRVEEDHDFTVESDGVEYVLSTVQCRFRPQTAHAVDHERDETYEAYGDRCTARQQVIWKLDEVYAIEDGEEYLVTDAPMDLFNVAEDGSSAAQPDSTESGDVDDIVWDANFDPLGRRADYVDPGDEEVILVEYDEVTYELMYTVDQVSVLG